MKWFSIAVMVLLLAGCAAPTPVKRSFPEAVPELMQQCETLRTVPVTDRVAITELLKTVIENYQLYYVCSSRVEGWQQWYRTQREIFESVK
jgi:uncharacterized lipoprotein YmbA